MPRAAASIITSPNGSGQSMGKSSAEAPPRNSSLCSSAISPTNSISPVISGRMWPSKYSSSTVSILAAIFKGWWLRRAISIASSSPFSGDVRPRKAR